MSRTRKGSKGPGWEPWSNLRERQEQQADYSLTDSIGAKLEIEHYFNMPTDDLIEELDRIQDGRYYHVQNTMYPGYILRAYIKELLEQEGVKLTPQ